MLLYNFAVSVYISHLLFGNQNTNNVYLSYCMSQSVRDCRYSCSVIVSLSISHASGSFIRLRLFQISRILSCDKFISLLQQVVGMYLVSTLTVQDGQFSCHYYLKLTKYVTSKKWLYSHVFVLATYMSNITKIGSLVIYKITPD